MVFPTLPERFLFVFFIQRLVGRSNIARCSIDDDIRCRAHILNGSRDLQTGLLKCTLLGDVSNIEGVPTLLCDKRLCIRARLGNLPVNGNLDHTILHCAEMEKAMLFILHEAD